MSYSQQPHQHPAPGVYGQPQRPSKKPQRKSSPVLGVVMLFVMAVALCTVGIAAVTSGMEDPPTDPASADRSTDAEVMCEEFINKRLKAPASAKYTHQSRQKNGAQYVVSGYVDSQNSFGAMVRTDFTCTVTDQGDGKWRLDDLRLAE